MFRRALVVSVLAAAALAPAAISASPSASAGTSPTRQYLIIAKGNALPAGLASQVAAAGGTLTGTVPQIGVAMATSASAGFAAAIRGNASIRSVSSAPNLRRIDPARTIAGPRVNFGSPPTSGDDDFFFDLQWGHDAVDAPEAWNAGQRGQGVRVAVLDDGFDLTHPDLAPNIAAARNFIPGETVQWPPALGVFSHGSHTAGTVAAADNGFGTIGVAPEADLLLGKVLPDAGCGGDGPILAGIVWAGGEANADVISMSLGAALSKSGYLEVGCSDGPEDDVYVTASEVAEIRHAYDRAVKFANDQGATVIASAGNSGLNSNETADLIHLPSDAVGVISISASAPIGWATAPSATFLDNLASYSNFGRSTIDFGAPGGDFIYPGEENCTVAGLTRPCWVFDLVFSTGSQGWYWSAGTSMAAPHAAGVAAIIIGANGGEMKPSQVLQALRASADRIFGNGSSAEFGNGRVNAGNAVT